MGKKMRTYLIVILLMVTINTIAKDTAVFDLTTLDGTNGFVSYGIEATTFSGTQVSTAGDINGDGLDDFLVSAIGLNNFAGAVYIVFGNDTGYNGTLQLADIDGTNGFVVEGLMQQNVLGSAVAGFGDINNDGVDDIAIGARGANNNSGAVYFIFGSNNGFDASFSLSTLDGSNGFVVNAIPQTGSNLGNAIAGVGDFNNDGIDDVMMAANRDRVDNSSPQTGAVYVLFGQQSFNASVSTTELNANKGRVIYGILENGQFGDSVTQAGDVNGDGLPDLVIGEFSSNGVDEYVYVIFADLVVFPEDFDLANLDGSNGFAIKGESQDHFFGSAISSDLDINNDGFDDIVIGASKWVDDNSPQTGRVYVIYGQVDSFGGLFDITALNGDNGFIVNGDIEGFNDDINLGMSVSSIGDFNHDSIDDLIISTRGAGNFFNGSCHVIYGNNNGFGASFDVNDLDGANGFSITGINSGDTIGESLSRAGDVNGDGAEDFLIGTPSESTNASSSGAVYTIFGKVPEIVEFELTVTKIGNGQGLVSADNGAIHCGDVCTDQYQENSMVTLIAQPEATMVFGGWSGACEGMGECQIVMDQAYEVIAEFINPDILLASSFE